MRLVAHLFRFFSVICDLVGFKGSRAFRNWDRGGREDHEDRGAGRNATS